MTETWKDIEGYEGLYQVSDKGQVKSLRYGRILKTYHDKLNLVAIVQLSSGGKRVSRSVRRLVALEFLPNPNGYSHVEVIDCNPMNCDVSNLRWIKSNNPHSGYLRKITQLEQQLQTQNKLLLDFAREAMENNKSIREHWHSNNLSFVELSRLQGHSATEFSNSKTYKQVVKLLEGAE
jgi:hypothetical protein